MAGFLRAAALLLTFATGMSGLVYEVTWQKYLAILLGSHAEATSAVLGIFLAGLSLGYVLFGRMTRRRIATAAAGSAPRLLLRYALIEAAIGVYALAFPSLFEVARAASLAAPLQVGLGFAFDVVLTALLIGPPAVLMGGTIPILTQALALDLDDATRIHARIYAVNTAGACIGALLAGFVFVPWLGLDGSLQAMAAVNLIAAGFFAAISLREPRITATLRSEKESEPDLLARPGGITRLTAVAALVGFAMMVIQTVAIRVSGLSFGASPFSFSIVVAVFVLCIALGSAAVSLLRSVSTKLVLGNHVALLIVVVLLYAFVDEAPFYVHRLRGLFGVEPSDFHPFFLAGAGGLLLTLGPAVLFSGASLPLLFHLARNTEDDLGATAGSLYAWNTVGSLAGALLGGYVLLLWLDLDQVYRVAACALVIAAGLLALGSREFASHRAAVAWTVLASALLIALAFPGWHPEKLYSGLFRYRTTQPVVERGALATARSVRRGSKPKFREDDPTTSVTVNQWGVGNSKVRSILSNGKPDGSTSEKDWPTMGLLALLPALIADEVERAFVIGWGTGITVGEFARLPEVQEVVVAEISSAVMNAAPLFDFANGKARTSLKVTVLQSDAYRALQRAQGSFDMIVSEPSNPWVSGVEMLYSREFLEAARGRLRAGGVYVQWYHEYESDLAATNLVLRTYLEVFDRVAVWYGSGGDLLLLGFEADDGRIDLDRLIARSKSRAMQAGLKRSGIRTLGGLLAHELVPTGVLNTISIDAPIQTLTHPRLTHIAARAFFRGSHAPVPFTGFGDAAQLGRERSLLQRALAATPSEERLRLFTDATLEACARRAAQCASFAGTLAVDDPRRAQGIADAAARDGLFKLKAIRSRLHDLRSLAGGGDLVATSAAVARRRTWLFHSMYQHGAPFSSDQLFGLWERCEDEDPNACALGLESARVLVSAGILPPDREPGEVTRPD